MHFFLWLPVVLFWLIVNNRLVFFIQIQFDIKCIEPLRLFFQLVFKGKRLLHFLFCGFKLCGGFLLSRLGGFQSGGELGNLILDSGQISEGIRPYATTLVSGTIKFLLMMPKCPDGLFAKKLFSLYLTYLPTDKFKYALKMNIDNRGSFTELVHTADCGQVSINISRPGIIKGQHWHNSKWELFIVVAGHGLIQERNINTGEMVEFEVSGDNIEAVHMIPGWTHNIINLSETENLVTVMTCNEIFNPKHPDTFFEPV